MCRLAAFTGGPEGRDIAALTGAFTDLDKSCGGHGMGVAILTSPVPLIRRGQALTAATCAELIAGRPENTGAIWHCRRASCGGVTDALCHPFWTTNKAKTYEVIFAHNGVVSGWELANRLLGIGARTDTEFMAFLTAQRGRGILREVALSGTIVMADRLQRRGVWGPWHLRAIRMPQGYLVAMPGGGVVSRPTVGLDCNLRDIVVGKWFTLRPGREVPAPEIIPWSPPVQLGFTPTGWEQTSALALWQDRSEVEDGRPDPNTTYLQVRVDQDSPVELMELRISRGETQDCVAVYVDQTAVCKITDSKRKVRKWLSKMERKTPLERGQVLCRLAGEL